MSLSEWKGNVAKEYIRQHTPYGDEWKQRLVNPVIIGVAESLIQDKKTGQNETDDIALNVYMVAQADNIGDGNLRGWHQSQEADLKSLAIVDLGCGNAYLGAWLTKLGAKYIGVDGSRDMLPRATRDTSTNSKLATHVQANLDGRGFEAEKLDNSVADLGDLTLFVLGIALDHLPCPEALMQWLSKAMAKRKDDCAALVFTLNWDYFASDGWSEDKRRSGLKATIASTGSVVTVYPIAPHTFAGLARDNRLFITQYAALRFSGQARPHEEPKNAIGLAPFHAYLLRPMPERVVEKADGKYSSIFKQLPKDLQSREYQVIRYEPGELVMRPHNAGGDVYVVLEGSLVLSAGEQEYGPGEMVGDLETGDDNLETYYVLPVIAGSEGALLARFSHRVLHPTDGSADRFGGVLFRQLRNRVVEMNWVNRALMSTGEKGTHAATTWPEQYLKEANEENKSEARRAQLSHALARKAHSLQVKGIDTREIKKQRIMLTKVAGVLLKASEAERHFGKRDKYGTFVALDSTRFGACIGAEHENNTSYNEALFALHNMGIVSWYPVMMLNPKCKIDKTSGIRPVGRSEVAIAAWKEIVTYCASKYDIPVANLRVLSVALEESGTSLLGKADRPSNTVKNLSNSLRATYPTTNACLSSLIRAYTMLFDLRYKKAYFYYIHDVNALRCFVLNGWGDVVGRMCLLTREAVYFDEDTRVRLYLQKAVEFIHGDINVDGKLRFSGMTTGVDVGSFESG